MANYNKPLTVSAIKKLKPDESIKDSREYAGLNVSCNKQGVKTFFYRYRSPIENRVRRVTIGVFVPAIKDEDLDKPLGQKQLGLSSAHQIIASLKAERRAGVCPKTRLDQERKANLEKDAAMQLTVKERVNNNLNNLACFFVPA